MPSVCEAVEMQLLEGLVVVLLDHRVKAAADGFERSAGRLLGTVLTRRGLSAALSSVWGLVQSSPAAAWPRLVMSSCNQASEVPSDAGRR